MKQNVPLGTSLLLVGLLLTFAVGCKKEANDATAAIETVCQFEWLTNQVDVTGEQGLFASLLKHFLESALEGEMDNHLQETRKTEQNRRNGKNSKTVKSSAGLLELTTPRDQIGTYQPQLVLSPSWSKKYSRFTAWVTVTPILVSTSQRCTIIASLTVS